MNRTQRDLFVLHQRLNDVIYNAENLTEAQVIVTEVQAKLMDISGEIE